MKLTNKLLVLVICLITLNVIGSYYFQSRQTRQYLEQSQLEWVETLTRSLSEGVAKDTINGNKIPVRELLLRIVKDRAIEFAFVTDMNGELFAHSFDSGFPRFLFERLSDHTETIETSHIDGKFKTRQGEIITFDAPLVKGLAARIHIGLNQTEVITLINKLNRDLFWFIIIIGGMVITVAFLIGRRISLPLSAFAQKLLDFSSGKDKKFPEIHTSDPDINNLVSIFEKVINEQEKAEEELKKSQYHLLLHRQLSPIGIIEWDTNFKFKDWNPAAEKIFGFTKEEVLGLHVTECILPEAAREMVDNIWKELITNTGGNYSINENLTKEGKVITCEWHNTPLVNEEGEVVGVASFVDDITQHQQQEEMLRRTQKMEALGKLTGGIAHDYNNMLGVVMGYSELLQESLNDQPELLDYVNEIYHAGERGKKLTQKILGFSHQKASEAKEIDINNLLTDSQDMLEKTLTVRIKLVFDLVEKVWPVLADISDLEDMILNMSINAMHAMESGGLLTFVTRNEHLESVDSSQLELDAGDYVVLTITDTGSGMDNETMSHIFDPFYTTKGTGGTGLGLSQVYGFVSRSKGAIKVYSEPGQGTRFAIYFPRFTGEDTDITNENSETDDAALRGTEKLLVVDDEIALGQLMKTILESKGYSVLLVDSGRKALDLLSSESGVDAVITDIIMSEMDGYQLASEILQRYPKMKVQLVSGFNDDRHEENVPDEMHQKLLYKPVNSMVLLRHIRELLDS